MPLDYLFPTENENFLSSQQCANFVITSEFEFPFIMAEIVLFWIIMIMKQSESVSIPSIFFA